MRTILVDGRLGRDAELRTSAAGGKYVAFSLANNSRVKNEDITTWYEVLCFDKNTVENRLDYLKKGKYIFVTGRYAVKAYVSKDGSLRLNEQILADRIDFIPTGKNSENSNNNQNYDDGASTGHINENMSVGATYENAQPSVAYAETVQVGQSSDEGDDELPF